MTGRLQAGYDRLARWYEPLERLRFGQTLQRARTSLLPRLAGAQRALFLGDGDGRLLAATAKAYPTLRITSVDVSPRMLQRQQQRVESLNGTGRMEWQQADITAIDFPTGAFDLVVTAFFLDSFQSPQLKSLLPRIDRWLTDNGRWYMVDFQLPPRGWRRLWARFWLWVMHLFFAWQTGLQSRYVVDPQPLLYDLHWKLLVEQQFHCDMIRAALYDRRLPTQVGGSENRAILGNQ